MAHPVAAPHHSALRANAQVLYQYVQGTDFDVIFDAASKGCLTTHSRAKILGSIWTNLLLTAVTPFL